MLKRNITKMTYGTIALKSRQSLDHFTFTSLFIITWLLFAFNTWNGDRVGYENNYDIRELQDWGYEILYGYLNIEFRNAGFTYQIFQGFIATVILLLYFQYFKTYSGNKSLACLMYLIGSFGLDYVLIRNTFAFAIFLIGIHFLFQGTLKGRFVFVIFVCISTLIHKSMAVFLIFVFAPITQVFRFHQLIYFYSAALILFIFSKNYLSSLANYSEHLLYYEKLNYMGLIIEIGLSLITFSLVYISKLFLIKRRSSLNLSGLNYSNAVFNINCIALLFIFLYIESNIFIRLLRYIIFLNLVYFSWVMVVDKKNSIFYFFSLMFWCSVLFLYFVFPQFEYTIAPLFNNNSLFN